MRKRLGDPPDGEWLKFWNEHDCSSRKTRLAPGGFLQRLNSSPVSDRRRPKNDDTATPGAGYRRNGERSKCGPCTRTKSRKGSGCHEHNLSVVRIFDLSRQRLCGFRTAILSELRADFRCGKGPQTHGARKPKQSHREVLRPLLFEFCQKPS